MVPLIKAATMYMENRLSPQELRNEKDSYESPETPTIRGMDMDNMVATDYRHELNQISDKECYLL
ncbi:MAG: hypothetical protein SV375_10905 [Thermodesulfobacteriota bacterium]|nr:hypothetical protein [Thermodesulfobacteriota bacterium]